MVAEPKTDPDAPNTDGDDVVPPNIEPPPSVGLGPPNTDVLVLDVVVVWVVPPNIEPELTGLVAPNTDSVEVAVPPNKGDLDKVVPPNTDPDEANCVPPPKIDPLASGLEVLNTEIEEAGSEDPPKPGLVVTAESKGFDETLNTDSDDDALAPTVATDSAILATDKVEDSVTDVCLESRVLEVPDADDKGAVDSKTIPNEDVTVVEPLKTDLLAPALVPKSEPPVVAVELTTEKPPLVTVMEALEGTALEI